LERDVSLNQFFLQRGLMSFCPRKVRPRLRVAERSRSVAEDLVEEIKLSLPPLRWLSDRAIQRGRIPAQLRRWEYVDWERTVAYSHGFFGNIYINLKGREPEGCVEPHDYESTRQKVADTLATLTDPDDGSRIVDHVYRKEELFSGPFLEQAPDLLVVMRDYAYITRGGNELTATQIVAPPAVRHSGNHRLDGMLVMWGPGIRQGAKLKSAHIMDVMPPLLQIMDIPVPSDVDGRVISEALEKPQQLAGVVKRLTRSEGNERRLTAAQEQLVRDRLRNLGYFE
jgi:predicted AlkP superfamily phosphohydrolase/phosphomutase